MTARWVRHVVFAVFALTACGGTVREDSGTPTEQLQSSGGSRCQAACVKVLECGLGSSSSCACSCACPDAGTNCKCGPCACPKTTEETPAQCESDCNEAVQKAAASANCASLMLKLLDCVSSASCSSGQVPCKAESDAMKTCMESGTSSDHSSSAPVVTPGSNIVGPIVSCRGASGGGSAAPNGSTLAPGTELCSVGWDDCSDGKSYSVQCDVTTPGSALICTCSVDGATQASFTASTCPESSTDANRLCGWSLE